MSDPRTVEQRLRALCNDGETLHGYAPVGSTAKGRYVLVVREWDHPDADDATILSERYAYLTNDPSRGSDGWVDNGVNRRNEFKRGEMAAKLAQLYASVAARQRADVNGERPPAVADLED